MWNRENLQPLLNRPEFRALLDVISDGQFEGADYNTLYGGSKFSSYEDHPRKRFPIRGGGSYTTAAGRYQILDVTWDGINRETGGMLSDFSPLNQDLAILYLILDETGTTVEEIMSGNILSYYNKLRKQWTSLPGASEARGGENTLDTLYKQYLAYRRGQGPAPSTLSGGGGNAPTIPGDSAYSTQQLAQALAEGIDGFVNAIFNRTGEFKWPYNQRDAITHTGSVPEVNRAMTNNTLSYGAGAPGFQFNEVSALAGQVIPGRPGSGGGIIPSKGTLTSGYGWRWGRMHNGIDIGAPIGTPILATMAGKVISAGFENNGFGNIVRLEHVGGNQSWYAHMSKFAVKLADIVQQGQVIGEVGSTGRSTGPHLHFEWRVRSGIGGGLNAVDPRLSVLKGLI
jgi:murein DD-endopeptidase MepM/ murein hydrolase activator NlpD